MLYLTVLLYIYEGQEAAFAEYVNLVRPLLAKHGGKLLYSKDPEEDSLAIPDQELPHKIQLMSFPDEAAFLAYRADPERAALADVHRRVIKRAVVMGNDGRRE